MRLAGKVAIITGCAGGMGEAAALLFAREGAKVAAVDIDEARIAPLIARIEAGGGTAIAIPADVTRTADVQRIVARTVTELGLPTVLFNNAGVDTESKRAMIDIAEADFDRVIEVNLKGPWLMMKHVVPHMIAAGSGSIVNTASIGAFIAASSAGYCASKAGLVGLTKVAAVELGKHRIRVNTLCPGATETPMAKHQREEMEKAGLPTSNDIIDRMGVLGRLARPEEMAQMALFLASDEFELRDRCGLRQRRRLDGDERHSGAGDGAVAYVPRRAHLDKLDAARDERGWFELSNGRSCRARDRARRGLAVETRCSAPTVKGNEDCLNRPTDESPRPVVSTPAVA